MSRSTPSNRDDVIDSRDVFERIEELRDDEDRDEDRDEDDAEELAALEALVSECENCAGDWIHGATLIRDSYFEDYAREYAEDIGALEKADHWPCNCIDWERACHELQMDYSSVDFDGIEYWVRS